MPSGQVRSEDMRLEFPEGLAGAGAEDLRDWDRTWQSSRSSRDVRLEIEDGYIGRGYALADAPVFETIEMVAQTEGIILDPVYTGKAFHGLVDQIKSGMTDHCSNVAFIHTGGAFGLYPYRDRFEAG